MAPKHTNSLVQKISHQNFLSKTFVLLKKSQDEWHNKIQVYKFSHLKNTITNQNFFWKILKKSKDEWCSKSNIIKNITNQNFSQILENFLLNITMNGIELQIYKLHYHIIKINKMLIKLQNIKFSVITLYYKVFKFLTLI